MSAGMEFEERAWSEGKRLLGIDEAGRGPLAGPLLVAGVVLRPGTRMAGLDDSKKLTEKKRNELFGEIISQADQYYIEIVAVEEIDRLNIYEATREAMERIAVTAACEEIITDAMPLRINRPYRALVKGDQRSASVAAASILAKVTRDQIMYAYDLLYPEYGLAKHKGYPTKAHLAALAANGCKLFYRRSYAPVAKLLK